MRTSFLPAGTHDLRFPHVDLLVGVVGEPLIDVGLKMCAANFCVQLEPSRAFVFQVEFRRAHGQSVNYRSLYLTEQPTAADVGVWVGQVLVCRGEQFFDR